MPNGFEKTLEEWEKKAQEYFTSVQKSQARLEELGKQQERLSVPLEDETITERLIRVAKPFLWEWGPAFPSPAKETMAKRLLTEEIRTVSSAIEKDDFYYRLYAEAPFVISGGKATTVDDILSKLNVPGDISSDELAQVESTLSDMISAITTGELPEMAAEAEELVLPELELPEKQPMPIGIQRITVSEILKALTAPEVPPQILTDEEWKSLLYETGQVEKEGDVLSMEEQADQLVKLWEERNNQMAAFRSGVAEMPEYKVTDILKEAVVQPGLALAEIAGIYFEHVSMPLAGLLYKNFIPDIEAEYQRLRKTESTWMAATHAWQEWDSNWFLKYMVMEALVDPLTYAGWGIATRIVKPVPYLGRWVGAAERGIQSVFEAPFDLIKAGVRKLPKTIGQRALSAQHQAGQIMEKYLTRFTGKYFNQITMKDWNDASEAALKFFKKHPQSEADAALAARQLLKHKPIDESLVRRWGDTLNTNLTPDEFTRVTIENTNNLFEDLFTLRAISPKEGAARLVGILGGENTPEMLKVAQRLLETRGNAIIREAMAFGQASSVYKAMQGLMRRNYRYHVAVEESAAYLARMEAGRYSVLLHDIGLRSQGIWKNYIDKIVVRPFAEAYLTFGMYGPMNVFEDYFRSALGGVFPRRMSIESWEKLSWGLSGDPELKRYGLSEMIGPLARAGSEEGWNNWVLQVAAFGQKRWSEKLYTAFVRLPGAYGMDVRRNFVGRRFMQVLVKRGGAQVERLARSGPKPPKLADRKLIKQLEAEVYRMKLTGNPDLVRGAKDLFTRKNIVRQEVRNILTEHPEMPNSAREFILKQYDDAIIFSEAGRSIDRTTAEAGSIITDEFLKGPEYASKQFEDLAQVLTELEVRNPQEMAQLMMSVNKMSEMLGSTPRQIMAQATIKSRGMPFAERNAMLNKSYQDIYGFMDRAEASIGRVTDRIRNQMAVTPQPRPKSSAVRDYWDTKLENNPLRLGSKDTDAGAYLAYRVENAGDILREWHGNRDFSYIREKFNKIYKNLGEKDWLDPISAGERARLESTKKLLSDLPTPDEASKAMKDVVGSILDRDVAAIRSNMGILDEILKTPTVGVSLSEEYIANSNRLLDILTTRREYTREFRTQNMATRSEIFAEATAKDLKSSTFWDDFYRQMDSEYAMLDQRMAELDGMMVQAIKSTDRAAGIVTTRPAIKVTARPLAPQDVAQLMGCRGDDISRALLDVLTAQNSKPHFVQYVLGHTQPDDVGFTKEAIGQVYDQIALSLNVKPETLSWMTSKQMELEAVRRDLHELWNAKLLPDEEIASIGKYIDDTANAVEELMYEPVRRPPKVPKHYTTDEVAEFLKADLWREHPVEGYWIITDKAGRAHTVAFVGRRKGKDIWQPVKKPGEETMIKDLPPVKAPPRKLKQEFADYDALRQSSMDEALKWYDKEYTDYTHANAFDAMMKTIYPYWTYESQRWFWVPRSFVRHPVALTQIGRWQNNTDYGYIHIPGTSVDINPFRGTVFGTMTTRLVRRDYPEYYDSLPFAGGYVEFMDFLSRYGFYPGAHLGIPLAIMGGREAQFGEILPASYKTVLDSMIATFPESKSMQAISTGIFNDRFRDYLTIREVDKRGGNGTLIFSKMKTEQPLTDEEQAVWNDSKSEVSWYSAGFEQFGMFRMRSDEQYEMYQNAATAIEEMTGYTPDQQDWLRKHGYRLWDLVGGMSPTEQMILEELDYYKWIGSVRPLLPGRQQEILNQIELGWDSVRKYTEDAMDEKLRIQREFLSGVVGPDDYNTRLIDLYTKQSEYIEQKIKEYPLMDIDNRKDYYKEFNIPQPVLHPMRELLNLYFDIELEDTTDPETGERIKDWDKFWNMREAVEDAIPDNFRQEWKDYISRNSTRMEETRREVYRTYFKKYNEIWQSVLETFDTEEQKLVEEYLYLERTGQQLDRQAEIKNTVRANGRKLISNFRSDVTGARRALRFANPALDAWLFYWGRTSSFMTPEAEKVYSQISKDTGRKI